MALAGQRHDFVHRTVRDDLVAGLRVAERRCEVRGRDQEVRHFSSDAQAVLVVDLVLRPAERGIDDRFGRLP